MKLYKYTGTIASLTVRFGEAETITLYHVHQSIRQALHWENPHW